MLLRGDNLKEYHVSKKALTLWRLRACIIGLILILTSIMLTMRYRWLIFADILIFILIFIAVFWYLPKLFNSCSCKIVNNTVILKIGVFFKTTHVFPLLRLIYSQTITTPLSKILGVTCVSLKAARNRVFIPELSVKDAEDLMNFLSYGDFNEI